MTRPLPFDVAPWSIGLRGLDTAQLGHRESVFSLSNGHLGWRGNLDEGEPHGTPGSYLNGVFEQRPMPYAEGGYGYPSSGETLVNVPNGKILRLLVDHEPLDLRNGEVRHHEQRLDLRSGILHRELEWTSPGGRTVRVTTSRLVSLTHRSIGAIRYAVEAVDTAVSVTVQSELVANERMPDVHPDPRVADALEEPFEQLADFLAGTRATLVHRTKRSGISVAVTMDHQITAPVPTETETEVLEHLARTTITARLGPGERLEIVKAVGHEWSSALSADALRDRAEGAVLEALREGWDGLAAGQRSYLDSFWECADVEIEGDPRLQQAVRFGLFSVLQSAARAELRPIPGKGLTGAGYEGHTFWDSEAFVLPLLSYTVPEAAAHTLRWRHATLDDARDRARELHLAGATFPWRTIGGSENSGYWPAGTIAFHINADIAAAVLRHIRATGDERFERDIGAEILVETARLWAALGRWDDTGGFHLDGLTGPDEYSAIQDDNLYTNLMAQQNLTAAADVARRHPDRAAELGVTDEEIGGWTLAAKALTIPYDARLGVHPQSAGFTDRERWDFEATAPEQYPLQDHFPYFDLYRTQVVKQVDVVLALHFRHDAFTPAEKARDFAYYEELTVRDSSLSASAQAVLAAEVGHLELAADYLFEAATLDLDDLHGNTEDGLHMASLAGIWTALVAGFGGMRHDPDGVVRFAPRLPPSLTRVSFGVRLAGHILRVEIRPDATRYALRGGEPRTLRHFGEPVTLHAGTDVTLPTPPLADPGPQPRQPRGRSPREVTAALDH